VASGEAEPATVRSDPALAVLVVLGALLAALVALPLLIAAGVVSEGDEPSTVAWILVGIGAYLGYSVTIFFGVAIVHAAGLVLDGEDATVGESIGFASKRLGPILGWSVVGRAVTLLLAFLRSRGAAGAIIAGLGGAAWSLVTFLAVPVISFEGLGPIATLKRSASLFRQRLRGDRGGVTSLRRGRPQVGRPGRLSNPQSPGGGGTTLVCSSASSRIACSIVRAITAAPSGSRWMAS
jgi:Family of unknown function (DUF6159)